MLIGENKQRFEEWFDYKLYHKLGVKYPESECSIFEFYRLDLEFQKGVYEKYFNSLGYEIMVKSWKHEGENCYLYSINENYKSSTYRQDNRLRFKTRLEAFTEAVKQLDKLINDEL